MARLPRISGTVVVICALLLTPARLLAADAQPMVAHVSFSNGTVTLRSVGGDVAAAAVNTPVFAGDEVATERGSLCEVQLDAATMFRFDAKTRALAADLSSGRREFRLERGDVEMRVFRSPADARVRTPSITVVAREPGAYRVSVAANGQTHVVVRSGRAAVPLPASGELALLPGTTLVASGSAANPTIAYRGAVVADDFDRWNDARDRLTGKTVAYAETTLDAALAANSLDGYGKWLNYGSYGSVWSPYVGSGWAPYTSGSWINTPLFGPTWLSNEPWGWAPYHYGRWIYDPSAGWLWVPGTTAVWSPALVAFIPLLFSNPFGASPFGPNVGWVPLAPGEFCQPWWGQHAGGAVVISTGTFANVGRLYNRPNWNRANFPTSVRFLQGSRVGTPVHVTPNIRMSAPMQVPAHAAAPRAVAAPVVRMAPSRAIAVPSARR